MPSLSSRIASLSFSTFDLLPRKCWPRTMPDGIVEWTPMSAVVLVEKGSSQEGTEDDSILTCVSLATGTKCLPHTSLSACRGTVLHDSHAEILALRGLNHFLLSEIEHGLLFPKYVSPFVTRIRSGSGRNYRPFYLHPSVKIYIFITSSPCGDASMDLLISSRPHDNVPWAHAPPLDEGGHLPLLLHGHEHFSLLGRVRLKPSRADAPPTHSKSCTDKLALGQLTGLLGFPLDVLMEQVFLSDLVLPRDAYHEEGFNRAFGAQGRLKQVVQSEESSIGNFFGYNVLPPSFAPFAYARPTSDSAKVSNVSALYVRGSGSTSSRADSTEVLINGVKQGFKQFSNAPSKESIVCRRRMWLLARRICELLEKERAEEEDPLVTGYFGDISVLCNADTYKCAKEHALRSAKAELKQKIVQRLGGWTTNEGDDEWPP